MKEKVSIFFGRFQFCHFGHMSVIMNALEKTDRLVIIIGSSEEKASQRNPLTYEQRKSHLISYMSDLDVNINRVSFAPMKDYSYNDLKWETEARRIVSDMVQYPADIYLTGFKKDNSSFYLSMFPEWGELPFTKFVMNLSSTNIRKQILQNDIAALSGIISPMVYTELQKPNNRIRSDLIALYDDHIDREYSESVNVVISSGHVLLIKDGDYYKLPTRAIKSNELIKDLSINTIIEDTGIDLTPNIIAARKLQGCVFDDPNRYGNGRVIAHADHYKLMNQKKLPKINSNCIWMPLHKLNRMDLIGDHFYIVKYFTGY